MTSRPSPPKPYERGRLTASLPGGTTSTAMTPVSVGSSSRPLASSLTSGYGRPPVREEFARARGTYDDRPGSGYGGSSYSSPSYSSSTIGPRPPPRSFDSSSRYGGYGSGYGSGYGGYGSGYNDYHPGRYGSMGMHGSGYGGMYGGSSYLNPYSRDPKYLMGEPGFPNAIESHFGWVNDFGRIVDTFARISWLLDMNLETIFGSFNAMLRFFDRIRFMNLAELAPMVQAVVFLAGLGVAGAKLAELIKGRGKSSDNDIAMFEAQFSGTSARGGKRRSKHMWAFVLLALVAAFLGTPLLFRLLGKIFKRESEKKAAEKGEPVRLRAMYDYQPESPQDLPLRAGDVVEILGTRSEGWLEARLPNGRMGVVPENYLEPVDAEPQQPQQQVVEQVEEIDRPLRSSMPAPRRIEEITS